MRLSKIGYYGDFVFYPVTVTALAAAALWTTTLESWPQWFLAFIGGFAAWTLIEYVLHRYVLHHVPYVKDMHDAHHADQMALIGTPTWFSAIIMVAIVFLPLYLIADFSIASGITCGLIVGYLWYVSVHHIVHHWRNEPGTYGYRLKRRHMLHHHFDDMGNFGVTSGFWDKVFGTDIATNTVRDGRKPRRERMGG
jgi:sterol desaturase/sphingolipid hydroxylase (fatty acid hydroxylase superfamily)